MMQKACQLVPGDCIGIVAPAGPVKQDLLNQGLEILQSWGYRTVLGSSVMAREGYLAGSDAARAADFNTLWADPGVHAVLCARGGYGSMRMLDLIDWERIRATPKFFGGFSDITALHAAMEKMACLVTFHGPMAAAWGGATEYNRAGLKAALCQTQPLGRVRWPPGHEGAPSPITIQPGIAIGRLAGGNLSLLCALMGTPYEPDFTDRLLLIEDVDEAPYRVDRMLTHLLLAGKLQRAAGILIGDSPTCLHGSPEVLSPNLLEVLADRLMPLGIPVLYGFPCGHSAYRATVPLGVEAELDADAGSLTITEAALETKPAARA